MSDTLASRYELLIVDLDGVVFLGEGAVPGAADAIRATVDGGTPVMFVTNNASRRADEIAVRLRSMGVPCDGEQVLTSAGAAAHLLEAELPAGAPVLVVGAPALAEEIEAVGLAPVWSAAERPVAVVQGYGPAVGWAQLAEACVAIRAGARWLATNIDATLPSPRGPLPGNGSLVAAVATALSGRAPDLVVGKPSPELFNAAASRHGGARALVVGDRLDTDIGGAVRAGLDSLLVLTGVAAAVDVLRAGPGERPTYVAADCAALSATADRFRVPTWDEDGQVARHSGWRVTRTADRLVLAGTGPDALPALAAAAWAGPGWTEIVAMGPAARGALEALGLGQAVKHAASSAELTQQ